MLLILEAAWQSSGYRLIPFDSTTGPESALIHLLCREASRSGATQEPAGITTDTQVVKVVLSGLIVFADFT